MESHVENAIPNTASGKTAMMELMRQEYVNARGANGLLQDARKSKLHTSSHCRSNAPLPREQLVGGARRGGIPRSFADSRTMAATYSLVLFGGCIPETHHGFD